MPSLKEKYPQVAEQWNVEKNGDLTADQVSFASAKKVWWRCEKGHEWESRVFSRTKNGSGCPYCKNKKADSENNLKAKFPDLMLEWHPTKNKLDPAQITLSSARKVWWACQNGHEWETHVFHRTKNGTGCPYCCNQKTDPANSLAVTHPHLLAEWDYSKNEISPYEVVANSHKYIHWKCPKAEDHVWETMIFNRATHDIGCPCCCGRKVVKSNCLATTHPEIAAEWNHSKNKLTPEQVTYANNSHFWFICSKGHEWKTSLATRSKGCNCPECAESKGEKAVAEYLTANNIKFEKQYSFDDCRHKRPLPFDFGVTRDGKSFCLVEFHGQQHYKESAFFGGQKTYDGIVLRDSIKTQYCKDKNIPLLVIPYWKMNSVNDLLREFFEEN